MTSAEVLSGAGRWGVDIGHVLPWLKSLPDNCVHCCATSPPYFGLRSYLPPGHPDKAHEIGGEPMPREYVEKLVAVFREVRRALHPSGCLFLNLGDSYCNAGSRNNGTGLDGKRRGGMANTDGTWADAKEQHHDRRYTLRSEGIKHKDLMMIPAMVAIALREDGWYLRQKCPWLKRNSMPDSTEDRPGSACEDIFLLSKSSRYYFDPVATEIPAMSPERDRERPFGESIVESKRRGRDQSCGSNGETRNRRNADWWFESVGMLMSGDEIAGFDVPVKPYKGSHYAVWPKELVRPMIEAGTSEKGVCPHCGEPWTRQVEKVRAATRPGTDSKITKQDAVGKKTYTGFNARWDAATVGNRDPERHTTRTKTLGWEPGCSCEGNNPIPAVVLDPFAGSGTTLAVAVDLGRRAIGCDLDERNRKLVMRRLAGVTPSLLAGA